MSAVISGNSDPIGSGEGDRSGDIGMGNSGDHPPEEQTPSVLFVRAMPVMALKLESRACGLLVAWVRDTVIFVDALCMAEEV